MSKIIIQNRDKFLLSLLKKYEDVDAADSEVSLS